MNQPSETQAAFDHHLDDCPQCGDEPFSFCPTGTRLLMDAASEIADICRKKLEESYD